MGGSTMRDIFEESPEVTASLSKIVIQPMSGADTIRNWFNEHRWFINDEELIYEDGQYYQIIGCGRTENEYIANNATEIKGRKNNEKEGLDEGNTDQDNLLTMSILIDNIKETAFKELEASYGPLLIRKRHPLLKPLIEKDMAGLQEIINMLAKSKSNEAKNRYASFTDRYNSLRELKEWL
jgi:tRNA A22 N-methylase